MKAKAKEKAKMLWQARGRDGGLTQFSSKPYYYEGMWLSKKEMYFPPQGGITIHISFDRILGLFSKYSLRRIK